MEENNILGDGFDINSNSNVQLIIDENFQQDDTEIKPTLTENTEETIPDNLNSEETIADNLNSEETIAELTVSEEIIPEFSKNEEKKSSYEIFNEPNKLNLLSNNESISS
jgi:hypothetical protein